jgi:hypothetical protein
MKKLQITILEFSDNEGIPKEFGSQNNPPCSITASFNNVSIELHAEVSEENNNLHVISFWSTSPVILSQYDHSDQKEVTPNSRMAFELVTDENTLIEVFVDRENGHNKIIVQGQDKPRVSPAPAV